MGEMHHAESRHLRGSLYTPRKTKTTQERHVQAAHKLVFALLSSCHDRRSIYSAPFFGFETKRSLGKYLVGGSSRDEEPFVDARVNGSGQQVLALGDVELAGVGAVGRVVDRRIGAMLALDTATGIIMDIKLTERSRPCWTCQ